EAQVRVSLDKAMYDPGETIQLTLTADAEVLGAKKGQYEVTVKQLDKTVDVLTGEWTATADNQIDEIIKWTAPSDDFKGYLFEIRLDDSKGKIVTTATSAADVSSTWTKFPRYGFLTNFDKGVETEGIIDQMKDWQLNGIEYYDWKYLHHQLIPEDGSMEWQDWAGRHISGETVKSYIADAKAKNMTNMSYNMIYAATNNYAKYGIKDEWGLWYAEDHESGKNKGDRFTFSMGASPTGQSNLFFLISEILTGKTTSSLKTSKR
ncbi:glycoside hydrolase family 66 protein, partial [Bavariicoccus seileri]|uniref:glycoside hydrolase family 66 protein n=1 Tax=Bavariicoccus seileri TaxID=549685 RepID=UPI003F91824C